MPERAPFTPGAAVRWQIGTTDEVTDEMGAVVTPPDPIYEHGVVVDCKLVATEGLWPDEWHVTVQVDDQPPFDLHADRLLS